MVEINKQQVGQRIKQLRTTATISMATLASSIDVASKSTINDWEKGRTLPNPERLTKLATYFHVSVNYLRYGNLNDYVTTVFKETGLNHSDFNVLLWEYIDLTTTNPNMLSGDVFTPATTLTDSADQVDIANTIITANIDAAVAQIVPLVVQQFATDNYPSPEEIIQIGSKTFRHQIQLIRRTFMGKYNRIVRLLDNVDLYEKLSPDTDLKDYLNQTLHPNKNVDALKIDALFQTRMNDLTTTFHHQLNQISADYQQALKTTDSPNTTSTP